MLFRSAALSAVIDRDIAALKKEEVPYRAVIYMDPDGAFTALEMAGGNESPAEITKKLDTTGATTFGASDLAGNFVIYDNAAADLIRGEPEMMIDLLARATTRGVMSTGARRPPAGETMLKYHEKLHGEDYAPADVMIKALKINPSAISLHFSLPENNPNRTGMLREKVNAYRIIDGQKVWDDGTPDTMRSDLQTLVEHADGFEKDNTNAGREIISCSSYGNLLMNDWLTAYANGKAIKRDDEPEGRSYLSIVIFTDGHIEFKYLMYDFAGNRVLDAETLIDITNSVKQAASGNAIVFDSKPVNPAGTFEQYYDLRHLVHLPFIGGDGKTIHFALDQLIEDKDKLKSASAGEAVTLELKAYQTVKG